jgi:hypothetical protein
MTTAAPSISVKTRRRAAASCGEDSYPRSGCDVEATNAREARVKAADAAGRSQNRRLLRGFTV